MITRSRRFFDPRKRRHFHHVTKHTEVMEGCSVVRTVARLSLRKALLEASRDSYRVRFNWRHNLVKTPLACIMSWPAASFYYTEPEEGVFLEHDVVETVADFQVGDLTVPKGTQGAVVHIHDEGSAYEVEFPNLPSGPGCFAIKPSLLKLVTPAPEGHDDDDEPTNSELMEALFGPDAGPGSMTDDEREFFGLD